MSSEPNKNSSWQNIPEQPDLRKGDGLLSRLAWLAIPLLLITLAILWGADLRTSYESLNLMLVLNIIFSMLICLFVVYLMSHSFLDRGSLGILMLGCGVLIWGLAALAGIVSSIMSSANHQMDINTVVTIHNVSVLLSALCHLTGVVLSLRRRVVRATGLWLASAYAGALLAIGLITLLTLAGRMPVFFVQGQGGTIVRHIVLGSATAIFALTAVHLTEAGSRPLSSFSKWYSLALSLIAVGLFGIMIESVHGSLLSWTGRTAQYLSGVYMFIAAIAAVRESHIWGISLEDALRESEERYRNLFMNMTEEVHFWRLVRDENGRIKTWRLVDANPPTLKTWGKSFEEVRGKTTDEIFGPGAAEHYMPTVQKIMTEGVPCSYEDYFPNLDRYFKFTSVPLGEYFITTGADITSIKKAQEALRQSQERLGLSVNAAQIGIFDWHIQTGELYWSRHHEIIFGYKPTNTINTMYSYRDWTDRVHPDDLRLVEDRMRRSMTEHTGFQTEYRIVWPDGSVHWIDINAMFYYDNKGKAIRMMGAIRDITARKHAEEKLRQAHERLRQFVDASIVGIVVANAAGVVLETNDYYLRLIGFTREEFNQGKVDWRAITPPEWRAADERALAELRASGTCTPFEKQYVRRDGTRVSVFIVDAILPGSQEEIASFVLDITERKQAEEKLRKSEEKFSALYTSMTEGAAIHEVIYSSDGKPINYVIIDVNPAFELVTGLSRDNVIGKKATEAYGTDKPPYLDIYGRVASSGKAESFETFFEPMNKYFSISVFSPAKGKFATVFQDITERRNAEKVIQTTIQRFYSTLSSMYGSILLVNNEGKVEFANRSFCDMFNLVGRPDDLIGLCSNEMIEKIKNGYEDPEKAVDRIREIVSHGQPVKGEEVMMSDGRTCLRDFIPINLEGKLYGRLWHHMDITERKQAEEQVRQTAQELKRSNMDLEQFAYVSSHDLREPLRAINGFMELLYKKYNEKLDASAIEYIRYATEGAKRMDDLLTGLLQYSRVGTHGKPFRQVSAQASLKSAITNLQRSIYETRAVITSDELPMVVADDIQVTQLFQNLIANALKFRNEHKPEIHVGYQKKEDCWQFSVRDNGIGIDPQFNERIFLIFQRLHTRDKYPGYGVGLSICKRIVERHGGEIWLESQLGQGSTFYFTIPE